MGSIGYLNDWEYGNVMGKWWELIVREILVSVGVWEGGVGDEDRMRGW